MATSTTMASTMTGMASGGDKVNEGKRLFCYNLSISNLQNCSKAAECHEPCAQGQAAICGWHVETTMGVRFDHVLTENNFGFRLVVEGNNILFLLSSINEAPNDL